MKEDDIECVHGSGHHCRDALDKWIDDNFDVEPWGNIWREEHKNNGRVIGKRIWKRGRKPFRPGDLVLCRTFGYSQVFEVLASRTKPNLVKQR